MNDEMTGSGFLNVLSKITSSSVGKKVASVASIKTIRELGKKGLTNVIEKGSSEAGTALGKLGANEIEKLIKRRNNSGNIKKHILGYDKKRSKKQSISKDFNDFL